MPTATQIIEQRKKMLESGGAISPTLAAKVRTIDDVLSERGYRSPESIQNVADAQQNSVTPIVQQPTKIINSDLQAVDKRRLSAASSIPAVTPQINTVPQMSYPDFKRQEYNIPEVNPVKPYLNRGRYIVVDDKAKGRTQGMPDKEPAKVPDNQPSWGKTVGSSLLGGVAQTQTGMFNLPRKAIEGVSIGLDAVLPKFIYNKEMQNNDPIKKALDKAVKSNEERAMQYQQDLEGAKGIKGFVAAGLPALPQIVMAAFGGAAASGSSALSGLSTAAKQLIPFGTLAAGGYAKEAENEGASYGQQVAYGLLGGTAEAATEVIPLGRALDLMKKFGAGEIAEKGAKTLIGKYGKTAMQIIGAKLSEGLQEAIMSPLGQGAKKLTYDKDMKWTGKDGVVDWKDIKDSFYGGISMAVILGGLALPSTYAAHKLAAGKLDSDEAITPEFIQNELMPALQQDTTAMENESNQVAKIQQAPQEFEWAYKQVMSGKNIPPALEKKYPVLVDFKKNLEAEKNRPAEIQKQVVEKETNAIAEDRNSLFDALQNTTKSNILSTEEVSSVPGVKINSYTDYIPRELNKQQPINAEVYRGRSKEDKDYSGVGRYGEGTYYTNSPKVADIFAKNRGEGGFVEKSNVALGKPFVNYELDTTTEEYKNLVELLKGEGIKEGIINKVLKAEDENAFDGIASLFAKGDTTSKMWAGSNKASTIIRKAGYDGIIGENKNLPDMPNHIEIVRFDTRTTSNAPGKPTSKVKNEVAETIGEGDKEAKKQPWQMTKNEYFESETKGSLPAHSRSEEGWIVTDNAKGQENWWDTPPAKSGLTGERTTLGEFYERAHKKSIDKALAEGKEVPAEVLKDYPELKKKPETKAPEKVESKPKPTKKAEEKKPSAPTKATETATKEENNTSTKIDDFGKKIGDAKKDRWNERGLLSSDLDSMNDREIDKHLTKDNIWKKNDYTKMIEDGIPVEVAYFIKKVRDSMATKPSYSYKDNTPELKKARQQEFIETVTNIKNAVENVKTKADVFNTMQKALIDNGYIEDSGHGSFNRYSATEKGKSNNTITNSLFKSIYMNERAYGELSYKAKKDQFGVSVEDKIPKGFDIEFFDGTGGFSKGEEWKPNTYYVVRGHSILKTNFDTEGEALAWLKETVKGATSKNGKKRFVPEQLKNIRREGIDYRNNGTRQIEGQDYLDEFGFPGGEFGNWLNQNDRQESLNFGYDALMDLSDALEIVREDISLNGVLNIAFGARGSGNAAAHYEPLRKVINLTKMKGAGSLAHEWFHAFDDFIGDKLGLKGFASEKIVGDKLASFEKLVDVMKYKAETAEEAKVSTGKSNSKSIRSATAWVNNAFQYTKSKMNDAQKQKFESLLAAYLEGKDGAVDKLNDLKKEVSGHVIPKSERDQIEIWHGILKSTQKDEVTVRKRKTDYYQNSINMGKVSMKDGGYWESTIEMLARAFACYITDKTEGKSDYLSGHSDTILTLSVNDKGEMDIVKAFPEGEERAAINKAFDELFEELKAKGFLANREVEKKNKPTSEVTANTDATPTEDNKPSIEKEPEKPAEVKVKEEPQKNPSQIADDIYKAMREDIKKSADWIKGEDISPRTYVSDYIANNPKLIPDYVKNESDVMDYLVGLSAGQISDIKSKQEPQTAAEERKEFAEEVAAEKKLTNKQIEDRVNTINAELEPLEQRQSSKALDSNEKRDISDKISDLLTERNALEKRIPQIVATPKTNVDKLQNALINEQLTIEGIELTKGKKYGFDYQQREQIAEELIEGSRTDNRKINIKVRDDGTMNVVNSEPVIADIMNELGIKKAETKIPYNIDKNTNLKIIVDKKNRFASPDGVYAAKVTDKEIQALKEFADNSRDASFQDDVDFTDRLLKPLEEAKTELTEIPKEQEDPYHKKGRIYTFKVGNTLYSFNKAYFDLFNKDGNRFYVTNNNTAAAAAKDANGNLIGVLLPIRNVLTQEQYDNLNPATGKDFFTKPKVNKGGTKSSAMVGKGPQMPKGDDSAILDGKDGAKTVDEIVNIIEDTIGVPIRTGKFRQRAHGIFKQLPEVIRTKVTNDLPTISHEIGHYLDKLYDLAKKQFDTELQALGQVTSRKSYKKEQIRAEGVAEFVRLYLTDPQQATLKAPKFLAHFEASINAELLKDLNDLRREIGKANNLPPTQKILNDISMGESRKSTKEASISGFLQKLYDAWIDEFAPISRAYKRAAQDGWTGKDVGAMAKVYRGLEAKVKANLKYAQTDLEGNVVGESLENILKPIRKQYKEFITYMVSRRAVDYEDKNFVMPQPYWVYQDNVAAMEAKHSHFKDVFDNLRKWEDNNIHLLVESGIKTEQTIEDIKQNNPNHVPLYRIQEAVDKIRAGSGNTLGQSKNVIKRAKGSGKTIIDPIESIIADAFIIRRAAEANDILKTLADMADSVEGFGDVMEAVPPGIRGTTFNVEEIAKTLEDMAIDTEGVDLDKLVTIFRASFSERPNEITVYRNGKAKLYQMESEIYKAIKGLNRQASHFLIRILNIPKRVIQAGAVTTVQFVMRNIARDTGTSLINSEAGINPIDIIKGYASAIKKDKWFKQWILTGGSSEYIQVADRTNVQDLEADILGINFADKVKELINNPTKENAIRVLLSPMRAIREGIEWSESGPRIAEMRKATEKGIGKDEAAVWSRDLSQDFLRHGYYGKELNKITAFFNANVQGIEKQVRTFKEHPYRTLVRGLLYVTLPTMILYFINDDNEEYKRMAEWRKALFYNIPLGNRKTTSHFLSIPKPYGWGYLFGALPEIILDEIKHDEPDTWKKIREDFAINFDIPLMPSAVGPAFEVATNKSWNKTPIESQGDKQKPAYLRYSNNTSSAAKTVANVAKNTAPISPKQLDYMVKGYTGPVGDFFWRLPDTIKKGIQTPDDYTNYPVVKSFITDTAYSNNTLDSFYDYGAELNERKNEAQETGSYRAISHLTEDVQNQLSGSLKNARLEYNRIADDFTDARKKVAEINSSDKFTPSQKKLMTREIQMKMVKKAEVYNKKYEQFKQKYEIK